MAQHKVALLGVPVDHNSSYMTGAALAPARIREAIHSDSSNMWTELGVNLGPRDEIIEGLERRLLTTYQESGRKVTLIGHSLGGVYAREMARQHPGAVRHVISLGSPIA